MADKVGQQIGNYRVIKALGHGSFADVYLGEHVHIHMLAAIKVLRANLSENYLPMFTQEAQTIAELIHPYIVRLLEFGIDYRDNSPYLIMDYAPKGTLRSIHPRGSIVPLGTVVSSIRQIAQALQYAHDHNLIHCDLKPENVLVGNKDQILVSDFGIASIAHSTRTEKTHEYSGTATYSAPEQIQGKPRKQSDQYALGIMVYEWLTGYPPFLGTFTDLFAQHIYAVPQPLHERVPGIPRQVEAVVMKALSKTPQERYEHITVFAQAFEQACTLPAALPQPTPPPPPPTPLPQIPVVPVTARGIPSHQPLVTLRNGLLLLLAALVIAAGVIGWAAVNQVRSQANAEATAAAMRTFATATAQAIATAEANPYGSGGTLSLNASLSDISQGGGWINASGQAGTCAFTGGAFHVSSPKGVYCYNKQNFGDFAFEVQMTIVQGDTGGIDFRLNEVNSTFYQFVISVDGRYALSRASGANATLLVQPAFSPVLKQGLGQTNIIAVAARGSTITLYANHQKLASASDSTYSFGFLGLLALPYNTNGNPTEVVYSNAKVWTY